MIPGWKDRAFDPVVIGIGEDFGLESHLIVFRPKRIASQCTTKRLKRFAAATALR
jgi:hypothetical protein